MPMFLPVRVSLLLLLALVVATVSAGEPKLPKAKPLKDRPQVENHLDVRYLPEWRYSGDPSPRRDYEMLLNLHLPPAQPGKRTPLVMYVHGGAYSAGNKDGDQDVLTHLLDSGFAVASLNYILFNRGIMPQVFWDFEDAMRFLRVNADRYRLDATAFGAFGISAGGWLITTAGHADGHGYVRGTNQEVYLRNQDKLVDRRPGIGEDSFLRPILSPETAYPGVYGRVQALAYDFSRMNDTANGFTPAMMQFIGAGAEGKHHAALEAAGVDFTLAMMTHAKYKGSAVHAPRMFKDRDEGETSMTRPLSGNGPDEQLANVMRDWFLRELRGPTARAPVPEIWPAQRLTPTPVEVSIVVPDPAIEVRYTLDGSDPGPASTRYAGPFTVPAGSKVRAFSAMAGRRPSRIVEAWFREAPLPPRVTAPLELELPPGQAGKPYAVQFTSDTPNARWNGQGDLRPSIPDRKFSLIFPNGMMLDGKGRLSGTPSQPGIYWVQVWVNQGPGHIAGHRNYRWTVTGSARPGDAPAAAPVEADPFKPLGTLVDWRENVLEGLRADLHAAGIRAVFEDSAKGRVMLLIPAADHAAARTVVEAQPQVGKAQRVEWTP